MAGATRQLGAIAEEVANPLFGIALCHRRAWLSVRKEPTIVRESKRANVVCAVRSTRGRMSRGLWGVDMGLGRTAKGEGEGRLRRGTGIGANGPEER